MIGLVAGLDSLREIFLHRDHGYALLPDLFMAWVARALVERKTLSPAHGDRIRSSGQRDIDHSLSVPGMAATRIGIDGLLGWPDCLGILGLSLCS